MEKINYKADGVNLFYGDELHRSTLRVGGLNVFFNYVEKIEGRRFDDPRFSLQGLNGTEVAKLNAARISDELNEKLEKIANISDQLKSN